jgi:hypothetical protein
MRLFHFDFDPLLQALSRWTRRGVSVCFVRRYCKSAEMMYWLRINLEDLRRHNPGMEAVDEMYGGQVLLIPNRVSPADVPPDLCVLKPWAFRVEDFRTFPRKDSLKDPHWDPPRPSFEPIVGTRAKEATWGRFEYTDGTGDHITITDGWEGRNIGRVDVPGLKGIPVPVEQGFIASQGTMRFNKRCHKQLIGLWTDWSRHGLIRQINTFDGAFVPRYMRRSTHVRDNLSNHSWGTAFDINASTNPLGRTPAGIGEPGCVKEMVTLAHKWGFYWGGHFGRGRADGMHFEVAKIL